MTTFYVPPFSQELPDHSKILQAVLQFFKNKPGVIGAYLSGSSATGIMDEDSDLDIGIVFKSPEARKDAWGSRWDWQIAPWFHRFDADHIKPFFIIYFFEPQVKADINLYLLSDLPSSAGGPYEIAWDETGALQQWQQGLEAPQAPSIDWHLAIHEDERFWAWMFYLYSHIHRGEYYHAAYEYPALRDILEQWAARLGGYSHFNTRYLENKAFGDPLYENDLFPKPDLESLKNSMLDAIEVQLYLREEITSLCGMPWKTSRHAIDKISRWVHGL